MTLATSALTPEQIAGFQDEGYLVSKIVLDPHQVAALSAAYFQCLAQLEKQGELKSIRDGQLVDGTETQVFQIRAAHRHHALFDDLIREPRILDAVECLLGPDLKVVLCQGLYKPPHTGGEVFWHQDDYYFRVSGDLPVVSCWIAFDEATVENGCMWVLPRHHDRLRDHEGLESSGYVMTGADENSGIPIELAAGQVMFHHGATPHRTLANTTDGPRRAMAIHYMDAKETPLGGNRTSEPPENMPVVRKRGHAPSVSGADLEREGDGRDAPIWHGYIKKLGVAGLIFFTAKGLLWLIVPALLVYFGASC